MLVLFDVDGTLTRSREEDAEFYARAFHDTYGMPLPTRDWAVYRNATDQGIAEEAVDKLALPAGRIPRFKKAFVEALASHLRRHPLAAVPGARDVLRRLVSEGLAVGIATGGWEEAARLKLASAGVEADGVALVGSDREPRRQEIVRAAIARGERRARTVYVGDGVWDVRAARRIRLPLVGIDAECTGKLRTLGVEHVLRGFEDFQAFLRALREARPPMLGQVHLRSG